MPAAVIHLDELAPIDLPDFPAGHRWLPVRNTLGIGAFGVNAYVGVDIGDEVIGEHDEAEPGDPQHEELYLVIRGRARFIVDGATTDAPVGTFVFVGDPSSVRSATALEPNTTVVVVGAQRGVPYAVSDWELQYTEGRVGPPRA